MVFGFDIDGVIADTEPQLLLGCIRGGHVPRGTRPEDLYTRIEVQFDIGEDDIKEVLSLDLYRHIPPFWEAVADIRRWIDAGQQIVYCTARGDSWTPGVEALTEEMLDVWGILDGSLGVRFLSSSNKHKLIEEFPLVSFTDDYDVVLNSMEGVVPHLFLMEAFSNRSCTDRERMSWSDISRMIGEIMDYGSNSAIESVRSA